MRVVYIVHSTTIIVGESFSLDFLNGASILLTGCLQCLFVIEVFLFLFDLNGSLITLTTPLSFRRNLPPLTSFDP